MEALQEVAKDNGPIGIRPVSKFAHTFIVDGHPTKTFNVKNKSGNTGPSAGLIPIDASYGRAPVLSDAENAFTRTAKLAVIMEKEDYMKAKHEKEILEAYQGDTFHETEHKLQQIDLKLTTIRVAELLELDSSMKLEEIHDSAFKYKITWGDPINRKEAYAMQNKDETLSIFDKDYQPVKILGRVVPSGEEKGVTADYDVLVVCPSYADFDPGGVDKTPFATQGLTEQRAAANRGVVADSKRHPEKYFQTESSTGGNWSERTENVVQSINNSIAAIDPTRDHEVMQTTHHNAEFNNPFADDIRNSLPALFVMPKAMDVSAVLGADAGPQQREAASSAEFVLIETPQELNALRHVIRDQGYYWPAHAAYVDTIQPFRPEVMEMFRAADERMEAARAERRESLNEGSTASIFHDLGADSASIPAPPDISTTLSMSQRLPDLAEAKPPRRTSEIKLDVAESDDDEIDEISMPSFDATPPVPRNASRPAPAETQETAITFRR